MSGWRIIMTDTESDSGVAPVCPQQQTKGGLHDRREWDKDFPTEFDEMSVYDCCPQPHIECWSVPSARSVMAVLNDVEAEICS